MADDHAFSLYCHGCGGFVLGVSWDGALSFLNGHIPHSQMIDAMQDVGTVSAMFAEIDDFLGRQK